MAEPSLPAPVTGHERPSDERVRVPVSAAAAGIERGPIQGDRAGSGIDPGDGRVEGAEIGVTLEEQIGRRDGVGHQSTILDKG